MTSNPEFLRNSLEVVPLEETAAIKRSELCIGWSSTRVVHVQLDYITTGITIAISQNADKDDKA